MKTNTLRTAKTMRLTKITLGIVVLAAGMLVLQTGCAKSKPSRFYLLSPLPAGDTAANRDLAVGIGPLKFPDYLLRPQIATHANANQLDYAEYDRWAEPLDENFARVLAGNLVRLIPTERVYIYPWLETLPVHYQLLVGVRSFGQTEDGRIELTVSWSIMDDASRQHLLKRRSTFSRPAPSADPMDYASVAAGMSELVGEFSREVAQALRDLQKH